MREITNEFSSRCGAVIRKKEGLNYLKFKNAEHDNVKNLLRQEKDE